MSSPAYSQVPIEEDFQDEEVPSSTPYTKKKKKSSSIICGWTFWLFLLILFALGVIGFIVLKDDPNHNLLAKLSLGDTNKEEPKMDHRIKQDDSSDYASVSSSSSSDSESGDSNDIGTEGQDTSSSTANKRDHDAIGESGAKQDNESNKDETNGSKDTPTTDGDDDAISESSSGEDESTSSNDNKNEDSEEEEPSEQLSAEAKEIDSSSDAMNDGDSDASDSDGSGSDEEDVPSVEDSDLDDGGDSITNGESTENQTPPEAGVNTYDDEMDEEQIIAALRQRLQPKELLYEKSEISDLRPHQFLHLHQMKTGGTSLDHYLRCALDRLRADKQLTIPYGNIHECSQVRYKKCRDDVDPNCKQRLVNASFMSYCAPLKDLEKFHWNTAEDDIRAVTVLRDPVDRVWSMFRFQTKSCYRCMNLTDVYDLIDNNRTGGFKDMCLKQLMNHETANMLSHSELLPHENPQYQQEPYASSLVKEAVDNMKSFFTAIGLLEELDRTVDTFGAIFPWFPSKVEWSKSTCGLSHENSSPRNNHCGADGKSHWDLPSHPDEHTRKVIEEHNQLDIAVYKAAVQHFWRQNDALFPGKRR